MTYCVSKECKKVLKCQRWWMNNFLETCQRIEYQSMADFYKKGKKCPYEQKKL